jgi:hemerythrin-like metal-binding protein
MEAPLQAMRVDWEPAFAGGHALIEGQHQALFELCNRLADLCASTDDAGAFDETLARLKALAHEHFEAELAVLAAAGDPALEDHQADVEEFDYLVEQIATTEHFDRLELQRFLALWWTGHVAAMAPRLREGPAAGSTSD